MGNKLISFSELESIKDSCSPIRVSKKTQSSKEYIFIYHINEDNNCIILRYSGEIIPPKHSKLIKHALSHPSALSKAITEIRKKYPKIKEFITPFNL